MNASRACARPLVVLGLVCCLPGLADESAPAAKQGPETAALFREARDLAKDDAATPAARVAMIRALEAEATDDAAALIASVGLAAAAPEPRSVAREALVRLAADPGVRRSLLQSFRRESRRPGPLAAEVAVVLLAAEADDPAAGFRTFFDRMPPAAMLAVTAAVCDAASRTPDETALVALKTLAAQRCCAISLACRRGLIATLATMPGPEPVGMLVEMLEGLRGEARGDLVARLEAVSGERHGLNVGGWRRWFEANRDTIGRLPPPPPPPLAAAPAADPEATQADYYDIPIYADRVVFVLDTSSSMQGAPLDAAKRELVSAIYALPEETFFAVVFFNTGVGPWQRQLVQATEPNKRAAAAFVNGLLADGLTATSDALQAAFTFDAEAIFFLSDGAPTAGQITDPAAIIDFVTRFNQGRYVSVNTISIMGGAAFLEALAEANHGSFRAVDE